MATAVKNSTNAATAPNSQTRLVAASAIGAVFVVACLAIVTVLVPVVWRNALVFVGFLPAADAVLSPFQLGGQALLQLLCAIGLVVLGLALAGPNPPDGTRAGVFAILAAVLVSFLLTVWIGGLLQKYIFKGEDSPIGLAIVGIIGAALLGAGLWYLTQPGFSRFAVAFEHQGWFRAKPYKASQGRWVRRLTVGALIIIFGSGIYSLHSHNMLTGQWAPRIPFTGGRYLPLLHDLKYTMPLVLVAMGVWVAWRAVNFPAFADFLVATEAEMNKVSWTSRRRLFQDTIVVLVTVVLFTVFLLVVDSLWGYLLSRETLGGIVPKAQQKQTTDNPQEQPW